MMVCVLVPLVLTVLLTETSASLSSSGTEQVFSCPPRWLLFGQRCFAFYPVWSSWSDADLLCSQAAGKLASLHTPEERQFVRLLANTHTPVWLGGYQEQQVPVKLLHAYGCTSTLLLLSPSALSLCSCHTPPPLHGRGYGSPLLHCS
ncbi:type-2 ice-structuring protein-like [Micropterus dolomieu]|uniref:type-2 ice-structuring protein-like n=1 Tax=Micropterus dolomieu TaxID=147949 RepID=UPI001E8D748F|nr:type-2 ice-structuring protein-like [Micropterus dolomieu]